MGYAQCVRHTVVLNAWGGLQLKALCETISQRISASTAFSRINFQRRVFRLFTTAVTAYTNSCSSYNKYNRCALCIDNVVRNKRTANFLPVRRAYRPRWHDRNGGLPRPRFCLTTSAVSRCTARALSAFWFAVTDADFSFRGFRELLVATVFLVSRRYCTTAVTAVAFGRQRFYQNEILRKTRCSLRRTGQTYAFSCKIFLKKYRKFESFTVPPTSAHT